RSRRRRRRARAGRPHAPAGLLDPRRLPRARLPQGPARQGRRRRRGGAGDRPRRRRRPARRVLPRQALLRVSRGAAGQGGGGAAGLRRGAGARRARRRRRARGRAAHRRPRRAAPGDGVAEARARERRGPRGRRAVRRRGATGAGPAARQEGAVRALVTGGAGFIGSHLVERLLAAGHEVRVLDDLSSGRNAGLLERLGVELVVGDAADPGTAAAAVSGCDAGCPLAAVASVAASVEEPLRTLRANLVSTVAVLEAAAAGGVSRFVYASSAAVYGRNQELPLREDARPQPLSPYAADKLAGEHYLAHH